MHGASQSSRDGSPRCPGVPCLCTTSSSSPPVSTPWHSCGAAVPAHGLELPGNLPSSFSLFHNSTTKEEGQILPGYWRNTLCICQVGRQECRSFWALWVLPKAHMQLQEFPNLALQDWLEREVHGRAWPQSPCCCHPAPRCGHSAPRGQLLAWGQSCHRAVLATQKALPWGGRCDDAKDEVGGHGCAAKKPILSTGFALDPAVRVS